MHGLAKSELGARHLGRPLVCFDAILASEFCRKFLAPPDHTAWCLRDLRVFLDRPTFAAFFTSSRTLESSELGETYALKDTAQPHWLLPRAQFRGRSGKRVQFSHAYSNLLTKRPRGRARLSFRYASNRSRMLPTLARQEQRLNMLSQRHLSFHRLRSVLRCTIRKRQGGMLFTDE